MCRWMAWLGQPVPIEELLFNTPHGIVDQALHARMGAEPTNGDGFGLGWYGHGEIPAVYRSVAPAWSDANLREIAAHVDSPLFITHVRAAIGSPVQQTNCHPFRHGRWLFVHNGYLAELAQVHISPGRPDAVVDRGAVARAVPAESEAVAVGRLGAHPRVQALVHDPVLGLEEQFVDQDRLSQPGHPATHAGLLSIPCRRARPARSRARA